MNLLIAFTHVRNCALASAQIRTRHGMSALKAVDKKIQSLMRKKAWREAARGVAPVHMFEADFQYPIPEDRVTTALRNLVAASERANHDAFTVPTIVPLMESVEAAKQVLAEIPVELPIK
jgi:hypothetical protein